jgi:iron(III) transport system ATP-binding protein
MDEPLANLDPHLRAAMEEELAAFHARAGVTTLYITHDQREAMALGDLVAVMKDGRFAQVAPPDEIYARPATEHVARFIGRAALLAAELETVEGGAGHARIGAAETTIVCGRDAKPGRSRVVVRPEDVALGEGPLSGRIAQARYRGGAWEAALAVPGLAEPLPVVSRARLAEGETASARIAGGWALPG